MSSLTLARLASRTLRSRRGQRSRLSLGALKGAPAGFTHTNCFSSSARMESGKGAMGHEDETFEEFTARYDRYGTGRERNLQTRTIRRLFQGKSWRFEKEFDMVQDVFELQRNLNNAFAYDLVPSPSVVAAALKAARRVNDYPTAVRVFEAVKAKVENKGQYDEYVRDLAPLREELGVNLKEELYPEPWQ